MQRFVISELVFADDMVIFQKLDQRPVGFKIKSKPRTITIFVGTRYCITGQYEVVEGSIRGVFEKQVLLWI